jgi:hypothetical protein
MKKNVSDKTLPISIVIATLGNSVINETIESINSGDFLPEKILICIPKSEFNNKYSFNSTNNIEIIETTCRGQVAQRAIGLSRAATKYVMQLDDDVIFMKDTLNKLFEILKNKGLGNVVAPLFRNHKNGDLGAKYKVGIYSILENLYATLVCGSHYGTKRIGTISSSGIGYGVAYSPIGERVIESEWIPGGVVLCHKEDLITQNYYPFEGKAYSEDLIHSILWRNNGCRLWTALDVQVFIDVSEESYKLRDIMNRYHAHLYVCKIKQGKILKTKLWLIFYCIKNIKKIMKQNVTL